jgi:methyl halide transferase
MNTLDAQYWQNRYQHNDTPWDANSITTPIKHFIDTYVANHCDKQSPILLPGAGTAHEAEYLHRQGYENVWVMDIAPEPLEAFRQRVPDFPEEHLLQADFFEFEKSDFFALIIEQTFFCALQPELRRRYAQKMQTLLRKEGILAGLLFCFPLDKTGEPPFGGSIDEYQQTFEPHFHIQTLAPCYNSIKPRAEKELFAILRSRG